MSFSTERLDYYWRNISFILLDVLIIYRELNMYRRKVWFQPNEYLKLPILTR